MQAHPYEPMLAVSGIDSTIKIFSPDSHARRAAAGAKGITAADASNFASIRYERRVSSAKPSASNRRNSDKDEEDDEDGDEKVAPHGLESRKRFDQMDSIVSQNDHERRTQVQSNYVSNSMLQLLRIGGQIGAVEGENMENCPMM
jgi:nuclear receptor interaction protein